MKKKLQEVKDDVTESTIEMTVEETKEKKSLKRFIKPALIFGGGLLLGGLLLVIGSSKDECEDDDSVEVQYRYFDEDGKELDITSEIENESKDLEELEDTTVN